VASESHPSERGRRGGSGSIERAGATGTAGADDGEAQDELRLPWKRSNEDFIRRWLVVGPFPGGLGTDALAAAGGEAAAQPTEGLEVQRADGSRISWHTVTSWVDTVGLDDLEAAKDDSVAYAFATVSRAAAGRALLSLGSDEGVRVWLNGKAGAQP